MADIGKPAGGVTGATEAPKFQLGINKTQSNKFISHLLGLDHEHPSSKKGSRAWAPSLSGVKISDALQGIKVTPNFMFLLLFVGFFGWLFVIYWIRHNEPFAESVLGKPRVHSAGAAADRLIVAGVKKTFPVRTSSSTGEVYVPGVPSVAELNQQQAAAVQTQQAQQYSGTSPYGAPAMHGQLSGAQLAGSHPSYGYANANSHAYTPQPQYAHPNSGMPVHGAMIPSGPYLAGQGHQAIPVGSHVMMPHPVPVQQVNSYGGNYMLGIQTESGTKVKTIVSR